MTFALRHLPRSRALQVLAIMAWLMLVTTSLIASPAPSVSGGGESSHAALVSHHHDHCDHADSRAAAAASACCHHQGDGCCQGHMGAACHCASLCGTALAPAPGYLTLSRIAPSTYRAHGAARAPTRVLLPPLRPPVA